MYRNVHSRRRRTGYESERLSSLDYVRLRFRSIPSPARPEPSSSRVAGSGMGLAPRFVNVVLVMGVKEPDRSNGCLEMSHLLFSWEA